MTDNSNLNKAKAAKNDEFYTLYKDIENELQHYKEFLKGKSVFCPCDSPASNFVKFLTDNYHEFGLTGLTAVGFTGSNESQIYRYDGSVATLEPAGYNGDFRNYHSFMMMKEHDVVITNPPFSIIRKFIAQVHQAQCDFLIVGPILFISYNQVLDLYEKKKLFVGHNTFVDFDTPEGPKRARCFWFTSFPVKKEQIIEFNKTFSDEYSYIDGTKIVNCDSMLDIPIDYDGPIAVPFSLMNKVDDRIHFIGSTKMSVYQARKHPILKPYIQNPKNLTTVNGKNIFNRMFILYIA